MRSETRILKECHEILDKWLQGCTRGGIVARNTVSIGIVVLDHIRKSCPVNKEAVISKGGEVKNARSGLGKVLESYNVPSSYLKEVTTRQGHQDGQRLFEQLEWGRILEDLKSSERDKILLNLLDVLVEHAKTWIERQNLKLDINRRQTPTAWIRLIVENAKQRSSGIVEQHLVGAKLERRFKGRKVSNHPAHAGDLQTARLGDFEVASIIYHVTANPSRKVIQKCAENIKAGQSPLLLVPGEQENKSKVLAQEEGIENELLIMSIENFIAVNIIELATDEKKDFFVVLKEIVDIYNRRLQEVESDLSLQIEVR